MGYCSNYNLSVSKASGDVTEEELQPILAKVKEISGYDWWASDGVYQGSGSLSLYDAKWYDHAAHMVDLSKAFPQYRLELACEGEDGDQWIVNALGGASITRHSEVVFQPNTLWA